MITVLVSTTVALILPILFTPYNIIPPLLFFIYVSVNPKASKIQPYLTTYLEDNC